MKPILSNLSSPAISDPQTHASFTTTKPSFSTHLQLDKSESILFASFPPGTRAMEENTLSKIMPSHFEFFCLILETFYRRNSWQMWENFSRVAADIGNFSQV